MGVRKNNSVMVKPLRSVQAAGPGLNILLTEKLAFFRIED